MLQDSGIKHVGIYARVSTNAEVQLKSLGKQVSGLIDIIAKDPYMSLYDVYVDIESGRNPRRNLNRLLEDCKAGNVNYVLVKSVSRLYRDTVGLLTFVRELRSCGVNVHFQNDNIDSISMDGEFTLTLIEAIAQAESYNKSEIIKWGLDKSRSDPNSKFNNREIYGYRRDAEGKLEIVENEAKVIRKIYAYYLEGLSVLKIIDLLKAEGIKSPRGSDKWSKESIRNILSNERYTGKIVEILTGRINTYNLNYGEIIDRETYCEVQRYKFERSNLTKDKDGKTIRSSKKFSSKK